MMDMVTGEDLIHTILMMITINLKKEEKQKSFTLVKE
jgi:hypothetical protein